MSRGQPKAALALLKVTEDDAGVRVPGRVLDVDAIELLEREEQLSALAVALSDVATRRVGQLVHGEAGIGKTALLRRFCAQADELVRVLWATCDPLFTPRPLGPLLDISRATGGELREQVDAGGQPYDVAGALVRELETRSPSVVIVEDLHWADEATLDVLRLCARRLEAQPLPPESSPPLVKRLPIWA